MEPSRQNSDTDLIVMIIAGALLLGGAGAAVTMMWHKVIAWCLSHGVLVPPSGSPMVALPNTGGAGLDLSRLAVAAAVVVIILALTARGIGRTLRSEPPR